MTCRKLVHRLTVGLLLEFEELGLFDAIGRLLVPVCRNLQHPTVVVLNRVDRRLSKRTFNLPLLAQSRRSTPLIVTACR